MGETPARGNQPPSDDRSTSQRFRDSAQVDHGDDHREDDLWEGTYSSKAMCGTWCGVTLISGLLVAGTVYASMVGAPPFLWLVALAAIVLLWIVPAVILAYRKLSVKYELTDQRFIHQAGILRRTTDRIELIDMDDVTYEQGVVERMFGVGTIKIESSDRTHPQLVLQGIDDVKNIADMIDDARRRERRRRGLHIETI